MKIETKARKIKLSAEQDLYQKAGSYFLQTFYSCRGLSENGDVLFSVDIGIKYWRYDELKEGIISPENPIKFTDKIRANSQAMCPCSFPRRTVSFPWDGTDEKLPELCNALLDYITSFQNDFIQEAEEQYGGLDAFYIAHERDYPLMAGLTYVERGLFKDAERCFSDSKMPLANAFISFKAYTEEQVKLDLNMENRYKECCQIKSGFIEEKLMEKYLEMLKNSGTKGDIEKGVSITSSLRE